MTGAEAFGRPFMETLGNIGSVHEDIVGHHELTVRIFDGRSCGAVIDPDADLAMRSPDRARASTVLPYKASSTV
jgi:hypothetical protein